jgi:hypothetical protein
MYKGNSRQVVGAPPLLPNPFLSILLYGIRTYVSQWFTHISLFIDINQILSIQHLNYDIL